MNTKTMTRRDFLKDIAMSAGALAIIPAAKARGEILESQSKSVEIEGHERYPIGECFYGQVSFMIKKVTELVKKTKGVFNPKTKVFGNNFYIAVSPKVQVAMTCRNEHGYSVEEFCRAVWPRCQIVSNSEIDVIYEGGKYREGHLQSNVSAIIFNKFYGDNSTGDLGFVYFKD